MFDPTWPMATTTLVGALAVLPGMIVVHHALYLYGPRRQQFKQSLKSRNGSTIHQVREGLETLYFGRLSILVRYGVPALMNVGLCALALGALMAPNVYLPWLVTPAAMPPGAAFDANSAAEVLRGARFAFAGSYISVVLLLTERAFRRDVSSGIALWSGALMVVGPISGGACALLLASGVGVGAPSFTRDAIFFVAGMLPRQFTTLIREQVRRMMQPAAAAIATRALPIAVLRGVTSAVEDRLAEEGIEDVATLAYAQPFKLMRVTSFDARQIVQWIDEALLMSTLPDHWQALEKAGITGAMDVAWLVGDDAGRTAVAAEAKLNEAVLRSIAQRLAEDAQVKDLYALYWSEFDDIPMRGRKEAGDDLEIRRFRIQPGANRTDLEALAAALQRDGFATTLGEMLTVETSAAGAPALDAALMRFPGAASLIDVHFV